MPSPNSHISIPNAADGYYESVDGSSPRTIRVEKTDGEFLIGWSIGRRHRVPRTGYRKMQRKSYGD
ncbi:MAG: hypothetical protein MH252_08315 [Thermosynechococcaceae cyanobacterium MS004]|nr:hypothetical protein [Thermosynechococcaceae cyanobacterium MS004]